MSLFEALASDATNLHALTMADPYCTLRQVMQRFPEQIENQIKAMRMIAALADFHGVARHAAAPADIITLVIDAMRANQGRPEQCVVFCALAKLLHSWRKVDMIVAQGGVLHLACFR